MPAAILWALCASLRGLSSEALFSSTEWETETESLGVGGWGGGGKVLEHGSHISCPALPAGRLCLLAFLLFWVLMVLGTKPRSFRLLGTLPLGYIPSPQNVCFLWRHFVRAQPGSTPQSPQ